MPPQTRVAVVTGANKGIGLAIVRNLALAYPASALSRASAAPLLIYLTARSPTRGAAAVASLQADPALVSARVLAPQGGPVALAFHALDISAPASIAAFAALLARDHAGAVDLVVNNAGIALDGFDARVARDTLRTNYFGTLDVVAALLPLVAKAAAVPPGRVVNVASMAGALGRYPPALQQRFREAAAAGGGAAAFEHAVGPTNAIMDEFVGAVERGEHERLGFPSAAYAVSKAGLIGATGAVALWEKAQAEKEGRPARVVNSCCPGWVNTDMTKGRGTKSVDEGAKTPVLLALGDVDGVVGEFWQDEKVKEW
ncbi:hypothetical protein B0J12DRAFT_322971 [Macrophomina phaseolina]|uniref:Short-chain dehydrogenase/reductase SDR n=1 Tax=Macrophomina phaseolina TaxID=35725 RepID=A0ABQ8FVX4_9PEZI|nr:hypothetical protein B0J12DRAFT_322971 [Macrophomina phaseolina]